MTVKHAAMPNESIRRLLVFRIGSLGDTIISLPCFKRVAEVFPNAERLLLTNFPAHAKAPAAAAILQNTGFIDGYISYHSGLRNPLAILRLIRRIRRFAPELVVYLMPLRPAKHIVRDLRFFSLCGVRRVLCIPDEYHQQPQLNPVTGLYHSEAQRLAETLSELGAPNLDNPAYWDLHLTEQEKHRAHQLSHAARSAPCGFIVCGPGTKMQAKDWGVERWTALLNKISATYPQLGLLLVGALEDRETAIAAASQWRSPVVNLCGQLTPRETAAAIEGARLFLGPDSGPMHLAAAVGVPAAIAFSARGLPGVWFPAGERHVIIYKYLPCRGCQLVTCIERDRECLAAITVDEMYSAARGVLDRE